MERHPHTQPHALFIALWRRHVARVRFMCLRAAHGNTAVAKDLVQDVAIHLLHACDTITPELPVTGDTNPYRITGHHSITGHGSP